MGGTTTGLYSFNTADKILMHLREAVASTDFSSEINISEILDLCRSARHPAMGWLVDFVEPRKSMGEINDLIAQIDSSVFKSSDSIELHDHLQADVYQLAGFQNIRSNMRAENGEVKEALSVLEKFKDKHLDDLDLSRKSNLLFSCCTAFLSDRQFHKSYEFYRDHWFLLKYSDPSERFESSMLDNWTLLNTIYWFFVKHVQDFRHFLSSQLKVYNKDIWNHKKISFLNILRDDDTWLVSLMGTGFYDHAKKMMPDLPAYTGPKSYIPRNESHQQLDMSARLMTDEFEGWQQVYAEKWDWQIVTEINRGGDYDYERCEDYKYSFFHWDNNHEKDARQHGRLLDFTKERDGTYHCLKEIASISYVGCALAPVYDELSQLGTTTCVDISEQVCFEMNKIEIYTEHSPVEQYVKRNKGDLLFSADLFSHLPRNRLVEMLEDASYNFRYLVCLIELGDDVRHMKGCFAHRSVNLHYPETPTWYTSIIKENYNIIDAVIEGQNLLYCLQSTNFK